ISPSPELLDRISAMMNEEVNRQKPPLRMKVTRYAGIAAAVAIAAGGTLFFVQSQGGFGGGRSNSINADTAGSVPAGAAEGFTYGTAQTTAAAAAAAVAETTAAADARIFDTVQITSTAAPAAAMEEAVPDDAAGNTESDGAAMYAIMAEEDGLSGDVPAAGAEDVPAGAAEKAPEDEAVIYIATAETAADTYSADENRTAPELPKEAVNEEKYAEGDVFVAAAVSEDTAADDDFAAEEAADEEAMPEEETAEDGITTSSPNAMTFEMSFDDRIREASSLIRARCEGCDTVTKSDSLERVEVLYNFTLENVISGCEVPVSFKLDIFADEYYENDIDKLKEYFTENPHFKTGTSYIIPLRIFSSVFTGEEYIGDNMYFELDGSGNIVNYSLSDDETGARLTTADEMIGYLNDNDLSCERGKIGTAYTTSDDISVVAAESDYIAEVEITGINTDFVPDRTSYDSNVITVYRSPGDVGETMDITMMKHAAEVGGRYLVLVNKVSKTGTMYVISSQMLSVFPADSPEAQEIIALIE
ncbi:MAG: hypothetical protein J6N15_04035, partial [Ruminiclostridium sp.]|nr:hypothetical protein [Ruminiclostridium sp.]